MPNPVTTIEFRFDREHCSKDGMFFQGPPYLLQLPQEGDFFDLDQPIGARGQVLHRVVRKEGRFTEIILHCKLEKEFPSHQNTFPKPPSFLNGVKSWLKRR